MAVGKTNAAHIRVKLDDINGQERDISASVSSISGVGLNYEEQDVTGYSDGVRNFTLGKPSSEIEITGPIDNTPGVGAHTVLAAANGYQANTLTLTVDIGIRAAPQSGDPRFQGEYYVSRYIVNGDGTYTARAVPGGSAAPAWTTVP